MLPEKKNKADRLWQMLEGVMQVGGLLK